jgi:hypothetical protein
MEAACGGVRLFGGKACRDDLPAFERRQVPGEGEDVSPVAILMQQGADPRRIARFERCLEGGEPIFGNPPNLLRGLKFQEGLIEIIHLGSPFPMVLLTGHYAGISCGVDANAGSESAPQILLPSKFRAEALEDDAAGFQHDRRSTIPNTAAPFCATNTIVVPVVRWETLPKYIAPSTLA